MGTAVSVDENKNEHLQMFYLIWLDSNSSDDRHTEEKLRSIVNKLETFEDVSKCVEYIEQTSDKNQLILIVSGRLGREIVPLIENIDQVISVYVYCFDRKANEEWTSKYSKVKGILTDIDQLVLQIKQNHFIEKQPEETLPIDIFVSGQSTNELNVKFIFFQVFLECLSKLKTNDEDKNELFQKLKDLYKDSEDEIENIDDFQSNYASAKALWWYTKECFFYPTLNAVLRRGDIHWIYLYRSYIFDIQQQLKLNQIEEIVKVYRGQKMSKRELNSLQKSVNQFISINSFFSTSSNRSQAIQFLNPEENFEIVLFEIEANPNVGKMKPFADISKLSYFTHEEEILFSIGSIFHLKRISYDDTKQFWTIEMNLASNDDNDLKDVLDYMKKKIGHKQIDLRTFANILSDMKKFDLAEQYLERMLKQLEPDDHLHIDLYENLGKIALQLGQTSKADEWFSKLNQFLKRNPSASLLNLQINFDNLIQINRNDIELYEEIGSGGFGAVHRAKWLRSDMIVAVKKLHLIHLNKDAEKNLFNELSLLNRIRHPNIISFYGACLEKDHYALIMEFMSLGSLYHILHEEKLQFSWSQRFSIALQAARAIHYLHRFQPTILHRDIKSLNLLLDKHHSEFIVKICDFGMAKTRSDITAQTKVNALMAFTLSWTAPEVLDLATYTTKSDIFSLGIVFWEIASYKRPYDDHQNNVIPQFVLSGRRLKIPNDTPPSFQTIINKCWTQKPEDRPTSVDLLKMINECIQNPDKPSVNPGLPITSGTPSESLNVNVDQTAKQMEDLMIKIDQLQEFTTPRYFFILPAKDYDLTIINNHENLFNLHFKLYFLCECSNDPKDLHVASSDGYSIRKLREFITKYGQYLQITLNLVKVLVSTGRFVLPQQTQSSTNLLLSNHFENINQKIDFVQQFLDKPETKLFYASFSSNGNNQLENLLIKITHLEELVNYIEQNDSTQFLGNLCRIITENQRFHWFCQQHYDIISFQKNNDFIKQIKALGGSFDDDKKELNLNQIKLTNDKVKLLSENLSKGFIVSTFILTDCSIYESDFDLFIENITNRSSIQYLHIHNFNILNYLGYSKYFCNYAEIKFSNHLLNIYFHDQSQQANLEIFQKILNQNKIHQTLQISTCDLFNYERRLQEFLDKHTIINQLIVNYANNIDILNSMFGLKINKLQRLKLIHSLGVTSVANHFCQLLKTNETIVQLDLIDAIDFYDKDFLRDLFKILKQHKSVKQLRLHISHLEYSDEKETLLISCLQNNFLTHLRLSKSKISSQLVQQFIDSIQKQHSLIHLEFYRCQLNENEIEQLKLLENQGKLFYLFISQQSYHFNNYKYDQNTNFHCFQLKSNLKWKQNAQTIAGGNGYEDQLNQLNRPTGIYVDHQQQQIYIADWNNDRIVKWKLGENNGKILAGGNGRGNRIDQLNKPIDVIVDENNKSLVICDSENRRVVRWSLESPNDKQIIINNIACWGLTMNENGDLFVSDSEKHEVKRWRKCEIGKEKGTVVAGGNGKGDKLNQLNWPTFLFIDRKETVYVSDWLNHRVIKWLKGAKEGIVVAGGQGKGNSLNQLSGPQGLIVNEVGDVYVADWENNRIMCWSLRSKEGRIVVGGNGAGDGSNQLYYPKGLSFDFENNLYVVDCFNHRIQRFSVEKAGK